MAYKKINKICDTCTKKYLGTPKQKYCGYICAKKAREKRITKICLFCEKQYIVQEWSNKTKYCSKDCQHADRKKNTYQTMSCKLCNKSFSRNKSKIDSSTNHFCSRLCADKYNKGSNHYE